MSIAGADPVQMYIYTYSNVRRILKKKKIVLVSVN